MRRSTIIGGFLRRSLPYNRSAAALFGTTPTRLSTMSKQFDGSVGGTADARDASYTNQQQVIDSVKEYYGQVLATSADLKTSACTACGLPPPAVRAALKRIPKVVTEKFYGCGNPIPNGIKGLTVLDLGCGSGRDCYVAALFAGKEGKVIGLDMTDEQLAVARGASAEFAAANPDSAPLEFKQGYIEEIGAAVADNSLDLVISNCVINLSPNKKLVMQGAYNALKVGGEMYFSDVYCDRRLSDEVRRDRLLLGECISGALFTTDFKYMCRKIGFEVRELQTAPIDIHDEKLRAVLGPAKFYSITYRLFKIDPAIHDDECEDYGQIAWYNGTIPNEPHQYVLDDHHVFETNRPMLVCGNTAAMIESSWLGKYFRVQGDRKTHFGTFGACGGNSASCAPSACDAGACDAGACGPSGGSCC